MGARESSVDPPKKTCLETRKNPNRAASGKDETLKKPS